MEKQKLIIIDTGHGGLIGDYQTSGKRSPDPETGGVLYEGVLNRAIGFELQFELSLRGIPCTMLAPENQDITLPTRVNRSKELHQKFDCFGISIHSNAHGDGKTWTKPNYWSVWTSEGETKSDLYAQDYVDKIKEKFPDVEIGRGVAGNPSMEKNYYIVARTPMPFLLLENFFMTSEKGYRLLTDHAERRKIVEALLEATICVYENM